MNDRRDPPCGLGGWLWPVTLAVVVLPLMLAAGFVAQIGSGIEYIIHNGLIHPYDQPWALRSIGLNLLLTLFVWWWAIRWFGRDPRLPRRGPTALLALAILIAALAIIDPRLPGYPILAATMLGLAILAFLGARHSERVRNTFLAPPLPPPPPGSSTVIFGGPDDWSRGRWILPGALFYAAFALHSEWRIFAEVASSAIPPSHAASSANDGCGLGFSVIGSGRSLREIEAHQDALSISLFSCLLVVAALRGFALGARWTPVVALGGITAAMLAPLRIVFDSWCSPFVDGPDFREMSLRWCVVLVIAAIGVGLRRSPRTTNQPTP